MGEGTSEPTGMTVPVGDYGPGGYPDYVTFRGTEIKRIPAVMEETGEFNRTRWYTLYETPDDGLKVHELETVRVGSEARQPGQRSAEEREVAARLFTQDELRRERPEIARNLFGGDRAVNP